MASAPGYDNNRSPRPAQQGVPAGDGNPAVQDAYEPGSTFKVVTFSAALSATTSTPSTTVHNLPNHIRFCDKVIHDDGGRAGRRRSPPPDPGEVVQHGHRHDRPDGRQAGPAAQWIYRYGLGRQTPLASARRVAGHRAAADATGTGSSIGTIPIGQGISVTRHADGVDVRGDRQRRRDGAAAPDRRSRAGSRPREAAHRRILAPGVDSELVSMLEGVVDGRRHRRARPASPATRWPARPAPLRSQRPGRLPRRASTSRRSSASCPPSNPQVEIMVVVDSPRRRASSAARWRRRRSSRSAPGSPHHSVAPDQARPCGSLEPPDPRIRWQMRLATLIEAVRPLRGARATVIRRSLASPTGRIGRAGRPARLRARVQQPTGTTSPPRRSPRRGGAGRGARRWRWRCRSCW